MFLHKLLSLLLFFYITDCRFISFFFLFFYFFNWTTFYWFASLTCVSFGCSWCFGEEHTCCRVKVVLFLRCFLRRKPSSKSAGVWFPNPLEFTEDKQKVDMISSRSVWHLILVSERQRKSDLNHNKGSENLQAFRSCQMETFVISISCMKHWCWESKGNHDGLRAMTPNICARDKTPPLPLPRGQTTRLLEQPADWREPHLTLYTHTGIYFMQFIFTMQHF